MPSAPFGANSTLSSILANAPSSSGSRLVTLEWSHSRQHLYDTCHRALYYSSVLAREGWRRDATEDARAAYRLKSLSSLPLVVGISLHERAAEMAKAVRVGDPLPTLVAMRERTRHTLNHVWSSSRQRRAEWMRQPKQVPMLREHYYGPVPSSDQLARTRERVERGLIALHGLALWGEIGALDPHNIALIDKLESYLLEPPEGEIGTVRVWAAPDLVVRYGEGGEIVVVDHKSGPVASGAALNRHLAQVASYALQLRSMGVLAEGQGCRGLLIYLADGTEMPFDITAQDIDEAAERIHKGAQAMALARTMADHAAMDAVIEARAAGARDVDLPIIVERAQRESPGYAMTPDRTKCRDCPFREVCARATKEMPSKSFRPKLPPSRCAGDGFQDPAWVGRRAQVAHMRARLREGSPGMESQAPRKWPGTPVSPTLARRAPAGVKPVSPAADLTGQAVSPIL